MKKAQIQNMESISVMIIIAILIILGIVFGFSQKTTEIEIQQKEVNEIDATSIAITAAGLKEIKCSSTVQSGNICLDYYRLKAMDSLMDPDTLEVYRYYFGLFKKSHITVNIISPNPTPDSPIEMYSYDDPANYNTTSSYFPVIVYNPVTKINYFSIMEIQVFS